MAASNESANAGLDRQEALPDAAERVGVRAELAAARRELLRMAGDLERARFEATAAARARDQFIDNVSHELRTPMNGIIGMTRLALQTDLTDEQREYLEAVRRSAEVLLELLGNVWDFSAIQAGGVVPAARGFSLQICLDEAVEALAGPAEQKGLHLTCRIGPHVPDALVGDPDRLRQVVAHLLGNAIKFTDAGSVSLTVDARQTEDTAAELHFAVADTGAGIRPDRQDAAFEPFTQADGSPTRRHGGAGLGLAICRRLVRMMAGRIWLDSEVGKGSTFHFTARFGLPGPPPPAAPAGEFNNPAAFRPTDAAREPGRARRPRPRALVVEAGTAGAIRAAEVLRTWGWQVDAVDDGRAACAAAAGAAYDAILLDVPIPGMGAFEVTRAIRRREKDGARRVPIIAMRSQAAWGDKQRCFEAGMDGYLTRPINPVRLRQAVEALLPEAARGPDPREGPDGPPAAEAAFDIHRALRHAGDDTALLREMVELFEDSWPRWWADARDSLAQGRMARLGGVARTVRDAVSQFAAGRAVDALTLLARTAAEEDRSRAWGALETAEREISALRRELLRGAREMESCGS